MTLRRLIPALFLLAAGLCAPAQDPAQTEESQLKTRYSVSVIDDATFYGNLREPLPTVLNQVLVEPSFGLRYRDRVSFSTSLIGLTTTYFDTYTRLRVKEAYAAISAGDFDFTAGRKMVRWGTGYAFTAAGVLDPPRNPTDPGDRLNVNEGRDMVKADWVRGPHAITIAWSTAALAPAGTNLHDTTAIRYNVLVHGFDTSLIAGDDRGGDAFGGFTFTRVLGQAWELHGEGVWREQAAALLGAKCTLHSGVTFIGEFYTPPNTAYFRDMRHFAPCGPPALCVSQRWKIAPARTAGLEGVGCLRGCGGEPRRPQLRGHRRREPLVRQSLLFVCAHGDSARQSHLGLRFRALHNSYFSGSPLPAMNRTPESALAACATTPPKIDWVRSFLKTAWIVPSTGLLVGVLLLVFQHPQLSAVGRRFVMPLSMQRSSGCHRRSC